VLNIAFLNNKFRSFSAERQDSLSMAGYWAAFISAGVQVIMIRPGAPIISLLENSCGCQKFTKNMLHCSNQEGKYRSFASIYFAFNILSFTLLLEY
jgi:hypothetical protein